MPASGRFEKKGFPPGKFRDYPYVAFVVVILNLVIQVVYRSYR